MANHQQHQASSENIAKVLSWNSAPDGVELDLTVQGQRVLYSGPPDVRSLLESRGDNTLYANVRINGDVLNRRDFENVSLADGDQIDVLYFMGGGVV